MKARYSVQPDEDGFAVVMTTPAGELSVIDHARTLPAAERKRDRWQKKEDAAT